MFVTFLVNDVFRANIGDMASSVQSAQNMYRIFLVTERVQQTADHIDAMVTNMQITNEGKPDVRIAETVANMGDADERNLDTLREELENEESFLKFIPESDQYAARLRTIKSASDAIKAQTDAAYVVASHYAAATSSGVPPNGSGDEIKAIDTLTQNDMAIQSAESQVGNVEGDALVNARKQLAQYEALSGKLTGVYILFFVIGWGLGLLGQLFGPK